jgi:SnoaL-like domain
MTTASELAARYIEIWNETDRVRRKGLMAATWTEDAAYVDPMMRGDGRDGIDAMIAGVQKQFPGHRFSLAGTPDSHNNRLRFSWSLAATGAPPVARGTDFCVVSVDGKLASVTGFLDEVAAET